VAKGNTLIAIGTANEALIKAKILNEKQLTSKKDSTANETRKPYVDAPENLGREQLGGVFVKGVLDLTHPLAFGYKEAQISLYKNNLVWLAPSRSPYSTVIRYTNDAHIDGYISKNIQTNFLPKAASLLVSPQGRGRIISFADNPNFRGTAYGTNRLFLNALFMGDKIQTPTE